MGQGQYPKNTEPDPFVSSQGGIYRGGVNSNDNI